MKHQSSNVRHNFYKEEDVETLNEVVPHLLKTVKSLRELFLALLEKELIIPDERCQTNRGLKLRYANNLATAIFHPIGNKISLALARQHKFKDGEDVDEIDREVAHSTARQFCGEQKDNDRYKDLISSVQIELRIREAIMENERKLRMLASGRKISKGNDKIVGNVALVNAYTRDKPSAENLLFLCICDVVRRKIASFTDLAILMR